MTFVISEDSKGGYVERIRDKALLLAGGLTAGFLLGMGVLELLAIFAGITLTCLFEYSENKYWLYVGYGVCLVIMILVPQFLLILPMLIYDMVYQRCWRMVLGAGASAGIAGYEAYISHGMNCISGVELKDRTVCAWAVFLVLWVGTAVFLGWRTRTYLQLKRAFLEQRDSSREMELWLKERNKDLTEKQEYEIRLATLRERNRIAREIHDNVGHMLSRSILQTAALTMIAKESAVKEQLGILSVTLNQAMDSIRESVHDLQDDSVNLESTVAKMLDGYEMYEIHYEYEIHSEMPRETKFCFLTVIKEALSNVVKHSNATEIRVVIQEFQDYYQLLFQDNGNCYEERTGDRGMGLENMKERVESLDGTMNLRTDQGFRIFISIPGK